MSTPANPRDLIAEARGDGRQDRFVADLVRELADALEAALRDTERLRHACLVRVSRAVSFDPHPPTDCADALARSAAIDAARSKP